MRGNRFQVKSIGLLFVGLALGLLLALQWRTPTPARLAETSYGRDRTALTIARLEAEQTTLKQQVSDLRQQLDNEQTQQGQSAELLGDLAQELEHQKALAGLYPLTGAGVEVVLNDSSRQVVPSAVNPEFYLVHDYDLRDVVNLLWAAGAEAVSVNDERIVATTAIYCVGATIMVNDTRMSPPYLVRAIGPSEQQESILKNPSLLSDFKGRVSQFGLEFKVARVNELLVPAYQGSFGVVYAGIPSSQ